MFSKQHGKMRALMDAAEHDGVTVEDGRNIYSHDSAFYEATRKLRDRGYMKKEEREGLPDRYVLTDRGRSIAAILDDGAGC